MTSAIDPTKPAEGNATTSSVRANFAAAATEIEQLQDAVTIPVVFSNNTHPLPAGLTALALQIAEADGSPTRAQLESFGNACQYAFRRANGTNAAKTALLLGQPIGNVAAHGYGATGYGSGSRIVINFVAAENWTDTAQGTQLDIFTTQAGTTTQAIKFRIGDNKNTTFTKFILAQYTTAGRPAYEKGALIFDTTLNKLLVGGATAWEVVTSV